MRTKRIVAFDLGLSTGIAEYRSWRTPRMIHRTVKVSTARRERVGERVLRFRQAITKILDKRGRTPDLVVYEDVRNHRGIAAAHWYGALRGELCAACEFREIPYRPVGVGVYKYHLTGNGRASKEMLAVCARRIVEKTNLAVPESIGYFTSHQDEADAICLLLYAMQKWILIGRGR